MAGKKAPKMERLVVNAIRQLQDAQGSTSREITNYISQEYDVNGPTIKKQVQLALRRGLSFGILRQTKGGSYTYNQDLLTKQPMEDDGLANCRGRRSRRARHGKRRRSRRAKCKRSGRRMSHRRSRRSRSRCKRRRSRSRRAACKPKRRRRSRSRRCKRRSSRRRKCRSIDVDNLEKTPKMDVEISRRPSRCPSCNSGSSDERQAEEPNQDTQMPENLDNGDD